MPRDTPLHIEEPNNALQIMTYQWGDKPISWKRAGRFRNVYFDKQETEKTALRDFITITYGKPTPLDCALRVIMEFAFALPKSWSKKKREELDGMPHISRPDVDNLAKFVADAFNDFIWKDDCLISTIHARKIYAKQGYTKITVQKI